MKYYFCCLLWLHFEIESYLFHSFDFVHNILLFASSFVFIGSTIKFPIAIYPSIHLSIIAWSSYRHLIVLLPIITSPFRLRLYDHTAHDEGGAQQYKIIIRQIIIKLGRVSFSTCGKTTEGTVLRWIATIGCVWIVAPADTSNIVLVKHIDLIWGKSHHPMW